MKFPCPTSDISAEAEDMPGSRIVGTGHAVPDRVVTNDDLARIMDTSDEWIIQRTGIRQRHWIVEGESGTALAKIAAERAIAAAGLSANDVELILYATVSPDHFAPGNGVFLQRDLGVGEIPAIDIRTQCSGFVYSMSIADAYVRAGMYRRILVVGAEVQSTGMDVSTRGRDTAVIFADGAGAVLVEADDDPDGSRVLAWDLHSDGSFAEKLWVDSPGAIYHPRNQAAHLDDKVYAHMEGREVFRHAIVRMPESVEAALAKAGVSVSDITLLIPHQANLRISEMVQRKLGLRDDQVYNNIDRFGNTTAATIPIALDECVRAGRLRRGDLVAITAFGSGFLWGSAVLKW
ncbi:MAG: beta-ketoacyl-ACP synthase III [Gemmatimonadaceae bacterium]|nr:beta-ketoacyl-ACP synthase III [Gemmatimonadaceae bacterium]